MHYQALLLNCMDPRLQGGNEIKIAAAAGFKPGEYEVLTYAGPSLWMTDPHEKTHADSFWWLLKNVSLNVHQINTVIIVGHSSCGGFALKGAPRDPADEKSAIIASLKSAREVILAEYLDKKVSLVFVKIDNKNGQNLPEIKMELIP